MPKVTFLPDEISIEVRQGLTLFNAAIEADVDLESQCGGKGGCALCKVIVRDGDDQLSEMKWEEQVHLGNVYHVTHERLACQSRVMGDVVVEIPEPIERPKKLYAPRAKAGIERILQQRIEAEESEKDATRAVKGRTRRRRRRPRGQGEAGDSAPQQAVSGRERQVQQPRRKKRSEQKDGEDKPARRGRRRRPRRRRGGGNKPGGGGGEGGGQGGNS